MLMISLTPAAAAVENIGAWTVEVTTDPMTDKTSTIVFVESETGSLNYACSARSETRTMFFFLSKTYLGGSGLSYEWRQMTIRVDGGAPVTAQWKYNDNYAGADSGETVRPVADLIRSGSELRLRAITYRGEQVDAAFSLHGAAEAMALVDRSCP